jgi:hypothetical protein
MSIRGIRVRMHETSLEKISVTPLNLRESVAEKCNAASFQHENTKTLLNQERLAFLRASLSTKP